MNRISESDIKRIVNRVIFEEKYTFMDWYEYNKKFFDNVFYHLIDGIYIENFVWTNNLDFVCDKIVEEMIKTYEYEKFRRSVPEEFDLLRSIYCDDIKKRFLEIKKKIS